MFGKSMHSVPPARLELLRRLPMFANFTEKELVVIDGLVCQTVIAPGDTLVIQGRAGREAFIVVSGEAEVLVDGQLVAHAAVGDVIGEMSLLDNRPRSATVIALTALEVLVVDPRQFAELMSDPRTARWLAKVMTKRLREVESIELDGPLAVVG
ncbi:MAG: cyclic nucleotide-binding domain-containing protein [Frankiaceae bacterium]|nr:cyclic nucleotide-binding domain-containing protein [Frankiaceae bacterium]MBV9869102.1 cyclic nucleotide-binding domain-containing protein [Frankiaceae bacterium]